MSDFALHVYSNTICIVHLKAKKSYIQIVNIIKEMLLTQCNGYQYHVHLISQLIGSRMTLKAVVPKHPKFRIMNT